MVGGAVLPLRDLLLWGLVPLLRTRGYSALPVHFLGKAATFNLLYAFPLLLLGDGEGTVATLADVFGWAFAIWGIGLYWWAGVLYAWQVHRCCRPTPRRAVHPMAETGTAPRTTARAHVTTPLLTLITEQALDEDYQHVAERRAAGRRTPPEPPPQPRGPAPRWSRCSACSSDRRRADLPQRRRSRTPAGRR